MDDQTAAADETQREAQLQKIKSTLQRDVNADLSVRATAASPDATASLDKVAEELHRNAIAQVSSQDHEVSRSRGIARGAQVLDYAFSLIYGLLGIRLVLALIAANSASGFVRLIYALTDPLYAMFRGIVPSPSIEGGFTLAVPILIALAAYALLHLALKGLMRMVARRSTTI